MSQLLLCLYYYINIIGEIKGWAANNVKSNAKLIPALCLPLISILYAIGNPTVDYFSLDIEGVELDVLKTIPWDKVHIKVNMLIKLRLLMDYL